MLERIVFTVPEVATMLGKSRSTVYRMIRNGDLPVVRVGDGHVFVPKRPFLDLFGVSDDGEARPQ